MVLVSTSRLLFLAQRAGLRMLEVPVRWDHHEGSKVHIVRDSLRMFCRSRELAHAGSRGAQRGGNSRRLSR